MKTKVKDGSNMNVRVNERPNPCRTWLKRGAVFVLLSAMASLMPGSLGAPIDTLLECVPIC